MASVDGIIPTSGAMGSSGVYYTTNYGVDNSSQNSVGGPTRLNYHLQPKGGRMGRRVSDGGGYVAAYRLFIEKRSPQLTQIKSNTSIDRVDSTSMSSTNSVKVLLQEKKAHGYGGLPNNHREWLQYKNQVRIGGSRE